MKTRSSDLKNIVIIGASCAGASAAHALEKICPETHRIVLVEANEFVYWPIGGLRGAVQPGFEKEIFASLDKFFKSDRHVVLKGYRVAGITPDSIELERPAPVGTPFEGATSISVDLGLVAAGSSYAVPMQPFGRDLDEAVEKLQVMQNEVAAAQHILIIGGGPVGVEFAGEVKDVHPDKRVTLVEMSDSLINGYKPAVHKKLMSQLKSRGVEVRLKTSLDLTKELRDASQRLVPDGGKLDVKLSDGVTIQTDLLFIGAGGKPNTDFVPEEILERKEQAKGPQRIDVDPKTLRVKHAEYGKKWFAAGDVCNTKDSKTAISATDHAAIATLQIGAIAKDNAKIAKNYKPKSQLIVVPFGKYGGAVQLPFIVLGEWVTSFIKGRGLFVSELFVPQYPGGLPLKDKSAK